MKRVQLNYFWRNVNYLNSSISSPRLYTYQFELSILTQFFVQGEYKSRPLKVELAVELIWQLRMLQIIKKYTKAQDLVQPQEIKSITS